MNTTGSQVSWQRTLPGCDSFHRLLISPLSDLVGGSEPQAAPPSGFLCITLVSLHYHLLADCFMRILPFYTQSSSLLPLSTFPSRKPRCRHPQTWLPSFSVSQGFWIFVSVVCGRVIGLCYQSLWTHVYPTGIPCSMKLLTLRLSDCFCFSVIL